jgi:hypothetical protein
MNGYFGTIQDSSRTAEMLEVAVDYFNKWVEAEALDSITAGKVIKFFKRNVLARLSIPQLERQISFNTLT